ncbi:MAG: LON peptidase substrate-binding domain-containing protein, partial [Bdellovibrionales bacterium]|nr:LON peptidase substrate-binding domain-containing protein [Bdellovibrionales bacterium]
MVEVPLFELDLVALPGEVIPLHVFEPRYQALLKECIGQKDRRRQGFVVSLKQDCLPQVGTFVRIIQVVEEYEDGRSVIIVQGKHRLELLKRQQDGIIPTVMACPYEDLYHDNSNGKALYQQIVTSIRLIVKMLGTDDDLE